MTVYEFEKYTLPTDVTGYIAVDDTRSLIVLAFRGTHGIRNELTDIDVFRVPTDICSNCDCHQGFWDSWIEARSGVTTAISNTQAMHPDYGVVVTGHSLGGAIADIAAAEIRKSGINCELYTYGAPRIAGSVLSDFITNTVNGSVYRVTHTDDPVPRLPPISLGFVHISPEYYIDAPTNIAPTAENITVFSGNINRNGNTPQNALFGTDLDAHLWYFNGISNCAPSGFAFK
ncbi:hypothetical protein P7C71_g5762, partial [Lecanoromycetidae sp. Uapishka_2]